MERRLNMLGKLPETGGILQDARKPMSGAGPPILLRTEVHDCFGSGELCHDLGYGGFRGEAVEHVEGVRFPVFDELVRPADALDGRVDAGRMQVIDDTRTKGRQLRIQQLCTSVSAKTLNRAARHGANSNPMARQYD